MLDTNVLLHDPLALYKFEDNDVVIPVYVIEEIDRFKKEASELGRNARTISREIDNLRDRSNGSLQKGIALDSGGSMRVAVPKDALEWKSPDNAAMDHAILTTALLVRDENPASPTVFVTMDSNLRIRADASGLHAENYEGGRVAIDELYSGVVECAASAELVDKLGGRLTVSITELASEQDISANACVILRDTAQSSHTALGRRYKNTDEIRPLRVPKEGAWGVRPRNKEQNFAVDLLLDDTINLVTLIGKAGTGKTLLAIACGLKKVVEEGVYARLLVSRPIFPLGKDIGYLPGDLEEKLNPWMQPIFDNLEYIFTTGSTRMSQARSYMELVASGIIEVEPLTYIRGRSLPNQFLIVDEAQNLTPHEVKTIITRCGSETKIVLTGDPYQIDNPYVDSESNGLTVLAERFRPEAIAAHMTLKKGERSELAERATQLL